MSADELRGPNPRPKGKAEARFRTSEKRRKCTITLRDGAKPGQVIVDYTFSPPIRDGEATTPAVHAVLDIIRFMATKGTRTVKP